MAQAALLSGCHQASPTLLAATKKQPIDLVQQYIDFENGEGRVAHLGESYVQELQLKRQLLTGQVRWYLIGALQRNKARLALEQADCILGMHSLELLQELEKQALKLEVEREYYIQVNISKDPAKSGFLPEALLTDPFLQAISGCSAMRLGGLMTITAAYSDPEKVRSDFRSLRILRGDLLLKIKDHKSAAGLMGLPISDLGLSMGMSDDFEMAIQEGATQVRIGSLLFGER